VSFEKRYLRYVINLNSGKFNSPSNAQQAFDNGSDTLTLDGVRSVATLLHVQGGATPYVGNAQIQIWGMKDADMAKLSTLGLDISRINQNALSVFAYNKGNSESAINVFNGTISNARLNYNAMPDVLLELEAYASFGQQTQTIPGTSVQGDADVATMLQGICAACNPPVTFVNNGVAAQLSNPAHAGSPEQQIREICLAAGISYQLSGNVLTIHNRGNPIDGVVIDVGPDSGMIGYPEYNLLGFDVTMQFNPEVRVGRQINMQASGTAKPMPIPGVPGTYYIWTVSHELSSELPGGPWFTRASLLAHGQYLRS